MSGKPANEEAVFDGAVQIVDSAERAAYLARPRVNARNPRLSGVVEKRLGELRALVRADTEEELQLVVADLPIRWYLLRPGKVVSWPTAVESQPAFQCGEYRVYDLDDWRRKPR